MNRSSTTIRSLAAVLAALLALAWLAVAVAPSASAAAIGPSSVSSTSSAPAGQRAGSLEAAASRAGEIGRKVAMSLIGLGFAIASIVLVFRRDFKEAIGVVAIGIVAVLLATPAGLSVLRDTVSSVFGS